MKMCEKCDARKQLTELKSAFLSVFLGDTPTKQVPLPLVDLSQSAAKVWHQTTWKELQGVVVEFIKDRLETGENFKIEGKTLYRAFVDFLVEYYPGKNVSMTAFGRALTRLRAQHELASIKKSKSNGHVVYSGCRLRES